MPAGIYSAPVAIVCAVLAWAGLEKIRSRSALAATVRALGGTTRFAAMAAIAVPVVELAASASVMVGAPSGVPAVLFAALGMAFVAAGIRAMRSPVVIACACLGASERSLGWKQLASLPLWLLAAWSVLHMPAYGLRVRLASGVVGMVMLTGIRAWSAIRLSVAARGDRRAYAGG
ncbi:MAG TPA: MauE/DoxX family redox-associated membrane protein [Streptosporangiaceae bacterium]